LDQLVKAWARAAAGGVEGRSIWAVWPGVFELKLVYNEGIAFGMLQGIGLLLTPVALLIVCFAAWYSFTRPKEPAVVHVTAALLVAGALGNLIDRLRLGKVTDMFWIRAINFPVFNVADVCITIAGTLMVVGALVEAFRPKRTSVGPSDDATTPTGPT